MFNRACLAKLYDGGLVKETRESGSKLLRLRFKSLQLDRKWERRSFGTSDVDAAIEKSNFFIMNIRHVLRTVFRRIMRKVLAISVRPIRINY